MTNTSITQARAELQKAKSTIVSELKSDDVIIGKDILELVSSAMYVDPMTVYREYIQNAADAIDAAKLVGLINPTERGTVHIDLDHVARSVKIRDNGTGVAWPDFARRLAAVGGSGKRGTPARGFRGVGRLAGLGYCQELIFRSRAAGENHVSELRWDCRKLKSSLRDVEQTASISELIRGIVTLLRREVTDEPEHFFEVEMKGIIRLRSDRLMTAASIAEYLSEVAPVPFSPDFRFGREIVDALSPHLDLGELDIRISGIETPVLRPHRDQFVLDGREPIAFDQMELLTLPAVDGDCAAVAWVLHHEYEGALPIGTQIKGLRLRCGNVQVGEHSLLEDLFQEPRFNGWSVGEIHIIDKKIVPNGRRDQFEQNAHYNNLINHLTPLAREISHLCRTSSIRRKWLKEFDINDRSAGEAIDVLKKGIIGENERQRLSRSVEQNLSQMAKIIKMPVLTTGFEETGASRINDRRNELDAIENSTIQPSPLAQMPDERRAAYEEVFELIYHCSASRIVAKSLIDRILLSLYDKRTETRKQLA